ncbi:hypothetical protein ACI2L4_28335 [Streptomyces sparsogenes]|uniref:hypothetical protein n=1 Tax=Streptomyces sparsogenes TaxID=67365 RepID=UPI0033F7DA83
MQIGKKAALMAAAAGAMVIGTAGGASAHGFGPLFGGGGAIQSNSCDTNTGAIATTGSVSSTGEVNVGSDCVNFTNSGAVAQSNDCDVTTGPIATTGNPSPTGDLNVGRPCTNIALAEKGTAPKNSNKGKKSNKKSHHRGHRY